jgi:hypothetical protein
MFGLKKVIKEFEKGNVCVVGLRGCGKDMLFANVIARRKQPYISNTNYKSKRSVYIPLEFSKFDVKNNWENFVSGDIIPYDYPYPEKCDTYIADCGVYLPSQYCNELNKKYPQFPVYYALSRHIADANVHFNVQNLNRVWDKLREQSDTYIRTTSCKVLGKIVFQRIVVYDKYQSCCDRVEPYKHIRIPFIASKELRAMLRQKDEELKRKFDETHGKVKAYRLIYFNRSKYDTRLFKGVLGGKK